MMDMTGVASMEIAPRKAKKKHSELRLGKRKERTDEYLEEMDGNAHPFPGLFCWINITTDGGRESEG